MSAGSPGPEHRSSLASLLLNLNSSAMSSISATIGGAARLVEHGSDEEKYYYTQHLENNTFDDDQAAFQEGQETQPATAGQDVRVIVVDIKTVRISDFKGNVRDWALVPSQAAVNGTV